MRNYRIAFFTIDWNYELVESTLHGIWQFVEDHPNVELVVFDCFGKDVDSARNRSEYAIFSLADLNHFDGLVIQANQIVLNSARQELGRRVVSTGIPAVTIDCAMAGCTLLAIDNRQAQYAITEHLIQKHGYRRLVYLTGRIDNGIAEAQDRLDGFLAACRDGGIPEENIEVHHGTWRTSDGYRLGKKWIDGGAPLPDAFVCANDEMALGLMSALQEAGVMIPEDVRVTGFDNISSSELSSPQLTTVGRDYARMDYEALELLLKKIDGINVPPQVAFPYTLIPSESCGCRSSSKEGSISAKYFRQTRFLRNFYNLQDQMAEELFEAADLPALMTAVERTHEIFGCRNVFLCINDYYYDNFDKKQWDHDSESFGKEMILAACGISDQDPDERHLYARFPTSLLLPGEIMQKSRFHIVYPLHYNTYSIGYLVMDSISETAKMNLHESIFSFLEIAIENVRKKQLLRQLNGVLDNLYVHDGLTGLYNRFGYERFARQTYDAMLADGGVQILFVDMDDMKGINDRFGHETGDLAIRTTADVLQDCCSGDDFIMRYGGDEFLIIASARETGLADAFRRAAAQTWSRKDLPFHLSLSVGTMQVSPGDGKTMEEYVQAADSQMYEVKKNRHKSRTPADYTVN